MSANTKIEWCDHTFNPWEGCAKVSPGCANCYASTRNARWHGGRAINWGPGAPRRRTSDANWKQPLKWDRDAAAHEQSHGDQTALGFDLGLYRRPRVFCASLADWLDDEVPIEWLADLLALIHATPHLDWLMLTKRPENCLPRMWQILNEIPRTNITLHDATARVMAEAFDSGPLSHNACLDNVWIGTSVENQDMADRRIPPLVSIPAKVRFLSCEPLLGPVSLGDTGMSFFDMSELIQWVIAGGESGANARRMVPEWARLLRDQCDAARVAFFMKQMGGRFKPFPPIPADLMVRQFPKGGGA